MIIPGSVPLGPRRIQIPVIFLEEKMENEKILKEFIGYTTLNILGMAGLSCYILADTFFISCDMGSDGITALNLALPIYSVIHGSGLMLGMGGSTKYSIAKSRGDDKAADIIFTNTLFFALILSLIYSLCGLFFSHRLTSLLGADSSIFELTETYLRVMMLFSPAFILNDMFLCFIRNDRSPALAMTAMLCGSFSNIFLDYLFIFPFKMGMFGAILATGLAPIISLTVQSLHKITGRNGFHITKTLPNPRLISEIFKLGVPSLVTELASGIVILVFNFISLALSGNAGVAAYGIVANVSLVAAAVFSGCAQGIQPLLSRVRGQSDGKTAALIFKYALAAGAIISAVMYGFILLKSGLITDIFNRDGDTLLHSLAVVGMRIYFAALPFMGFNMILTVFFTSAEKAIPAQILTLARGFFIIIPSAFILSALFDMTGIWLSFPVAEALSSVIGIIFLKNNKKMYYIDKIGTK